MDARDDAADHGGAGVTYDISGGAVPTAVVDTVASHQDTDPDELAPLYTVVDPDALETLLGDPRPEPTRPVEVTFHYAGLEVTVDSDATLHLEDSG